jgi:hypothetical protein
MMNMNAAFCRYMLRVYGQPRIAEAVQKFENAVRVLAEADNLVAGWSYSIQEKEDRLPSFTNLYVEAVIAWVLEPLSVSGAVEDQKS